MQKGKRRPSPDKGVQIVNRQRRLRLDRKLLRLAVTTVAEGESAVIGELNLVFVDDKSIAKLNEEFLGHEGPTDVITFPDSESELSAISNQPSAISGEIVISTETAIRTGERLGRKPHDEVLLYVIHGVLHLCGYDDHDREDRSKMRRRERKYMGLIK